MHANGQQHTCLPALQSHLATHCAWPYLCSCSSGADATAAGAALAARRREGAQLETALSGRLDPIDWATYEPYLYANKQRATTRSQVGIISTLQAAMKRLRPALPIATQMQAAMQL